MNEPRAVIDTGVVVSAVDLAVAQGRLLISAATVAELDEVLRRPKFNKYVEQQQRLEFLAALIDQAVPIEIVRR
jgi:predicted nucleic acid-binding protein